jgi:hypothetical protein
MNSGQDCGPTGMTTTKSTFSFILRLIQKLMNLINGQADRLFKISTGDQFSTHWSLFALFLRSKEKIRPMASVLQ